MPWSACVPPRSHIATWRLFSLLQIGTSGPSHLAVIMGFPDSYGEWMQGCFGEDPADMRAGVIFPWMRKGTLMLSFFFPLHLKPES